MRILLVGTQLSVGGVQNQIRLIAAGALERGHDVRVVGLFGDVTLRGLPAGRQVNLHLRQGDPFDVARGVRRLRDLVSEFGASVVHSHAVHANVISRFACLGLDVPLVSTVHNVREGGRAHDLAARLTFRLSRHNTAVSDAVRSSQEERRAAPPGRLTVQYNGIDPVFFEAVAVARRAAERAEVRREFGLRESDRAILAVGRLSEAKNFPVLVEAMRLLPADLSPVLLIAGEGALRPKILEQIAGSGLERRVHLLGTRTDIPRLLRSVDLFVLPSAWEGLPLVLGEAMAAGQRVVASDIDSNLEMAGPVATYAKQGEPDDLAQRIAEVLEEGVEARGARVAAGLHRAKTLFEPEAIIEQWMQRYSALGGAPSEQT